MAWRLLIVEDDDDVADSLVEVFTTRGYRVSRAHDGQEAFEIVKRLGARPDAILLDLLMPGMDGPAFLEARRAHPLLATVPVIVMTAQPDELARVHETVYARLSKPAPLKVVIDTVYGACHSAR